MGVLIEISLVILYTFLLIVIINKSGFFSSIGLEKKYLIGIFIFKILIGVALSLIYTYFYTDRLKADVFKYFDDGKIMYDALSGKPLDYLRMLLGINSDSPYFDTYYTQMNNWYRAYENNIYNDNRTIIRFNALLYLFSFGYFNVHTVFMSFFTLVGQTALYKFFRNNTNISSKLIIIAVFLSPSVLFWSSGVLKEGLLFFAMGFLLYFSDLLLKNFSFKYLVWIVFSILLLLFLKFYVFAALAPLLIAFYWSKKNSAKYILAKYALLLGFFILFSVNFHVFFSSYNLLEIMVNKQNDFYHLAIDQESGSQIAINKLEPYFLSFLKSTPKAVFNVLFLPHIFEKQHLLSYLSAVENFLLIILLIISLMFFRLKKADINLVVFCFLFTAILFTLTGLITPITGAIVRYKVPAIPFLLMGIFIITDTRSVKDFLRRITE